MQPQNKRGEFQISEDIFCRFWRKTKRQGLCIDFPTVLATTAGRTKECIQRITNFGLKSLLTAFGHSHWYGITFASESNLQLKAWLASQEPLQLPSERAYDLFGPHLQPFYSISQAVQNSRQIVQPLLRPFDRSFVALRCRFGIIEPNNNNNNNNRHSFLYATARRLL